MSNKNNIQEAITQNEFCIKSYKEEIRELEKARAILTNYRANQPEAGADVAIDWIDKQEAIVNASMRAAVTRNANYKKQLKLMEQLEALAAEA